MTNPIKASWAYSRTIFLNVLAIILMLLGEILSFMVGVDWTSVIHNPKLLFAWTFGINILNIVLRFVTTTPVGGKPLLHVEPVEPPDPVAPVEPPKDAQ